jgi:phosphate-selective porin OprO/OprP
VAKSAKSLKFSTRFKRTALCAALAATLALPAIASPQSTSLISASNQTSRKSEDSELIRLPATQPTEVQQLQQRVEQLEQQLDKVESRFQQDAGPQGGLSQASYSQPMASTDHQYWGESRSRNSRYPTIAWGGFLQLDTGLVDQDAASKDAFGTIAGQTGLRRVRLNVRGNVQPNLSYLIDVDYAADGHPSFRDVMFTAHDLDWVQNFRLGYYQQPFGLDAMTSGRELIFLERLLPFAFDPFRQTGFGCYGNAVEKTATWALSAYRFPTDDFGVSEGESGGWAVASRATAKLIDNEGGIEMVHVGLNYSVGNPGTNNVRYSIEPGFFVTDPTNSDPGGSVPKIVDTGDIPAETFNLFGVELAAQYGSLNFQSEVKGSLVDQKNGPTLGFWGVYAQVSWVLTGEVHPYDEERGTFRRVIPFSDGSVGHPSLGAWEVAGGLSYINLNDKNIAGGTASSAIFGINRYLSRYVKFQLNIIRVLADDPTYGDTGTTVAALRSQAEF